MSKKAFTSEKLTSAGWSVSSQLKPPALQTTPATPATPHNKISPSSLQTPTSTSLPLDPSSSSHSASSASSSSSSLAPSDVDLDKKSATKALVREMSQPRSAASQQQKQKSKIAKGLIRGSLSSGEAHAGSAQQDDPVIASPPHSPTASVDAVEQQHAAKSAAITSSVVVPQLVNKFQQSQAEHAIEHHDPGHEVVPKMVEDYEKALRSSDEPPSDKKRRKSKNKNKNDVHRLNTQVGSASSLPPSSSLSVTKHSSHNIIQHSAPQPFQSATTSAHQSQPVNRALVLTAPSASKVGSSTTRATSIWQSMQIIGRMCIWTLLLIVAVDLLRRNLATETACAFIGAASRWMGVLCCAVTPSSSSSAQSKTNRLLQSVLSIIASTTISSLPFIIATQILPSASAVGAFMLVRWQVVAVLLLAVGMIAVMRDRNRGLRGEDVELEEGDDVHAFENVMAASIMTIFALAWYLEHGTWEPLAAASIAWFGLIARPEPSLAFCFLSCLLAHHQASGSNTAALF